MSLKTHSLILVSDSRWEQTANYSCDPSESWRSLFVSAHLSRPKDLVVNGRHNGGEMNWFIQCYDNTYPSSAANSENALGQVNFQKDEIGRPCGWIFLSLQNHGFQDLWDRVTSRQLAKSTVVLDVLGLLPGDHQNNTRWLTSQADRLFVRGIEFRFNREADTTGGMPNPVSTKSGEDSAAR